MKSWKTSLGGYGAIGFQVAAVIWPKYAAKFTSVSLILSGAGLIAARDNNVTSEQAGAVKPVQPPTPNLMKKQLIALILTVAFIFGLTGCTSIPVAQAVAKIATKDATYFTLKEHPEWRPQFEIAYNEITVLAGADKIDVAALAAIIQRLPVKQLQSDRSKIIASDVEIIIETIVPENGQIVSAAHYTNAKQVISAIRDGLRLGLDMP